MEQGKIKKLVSDRGFGFIQPENGPDVFFHHSAVEGGMFDTLHVGQSVEYELGSGGGGGGGGKGPRAEKVRPVG